ncbi:PP2C family protein-serine/threonine phosphatase [Streptomyces lycii]|uniref:SpoIIE family protein phosphatase n=2 Tax=Streptomyces TaxID=1883 RepID=A0ABQ7FH32_9ACTN|nr:SpoIIE family protein phosphatase [Streptomyces lycii]
MGVPEPRSAGGGADPVTADTVLPRWRGEPESLLLVEDDSGDALLVEELLTDSDIRTELIWVRSLAEAKERLAATGRPGCILLDLHLPDASGVDAVGQILGAAPHTAVVVLTGRSEDEAGLAAVAAGAQDYLVKGSLEPQLFGRAIRYAVQRKQVEQAAADLQAGQLRAQENARLERGLLPTPLLHTEDLVVAARYEPGRAQSLLGGDFYDVVQTSDGTVHAVIGDVSGHGAAEAALGVCLRVAWRTAVLCGTTGSGAARLLEQITVAERSDPRVFATVLCLAFPPDRRTLRIVRAGHPGVLIRQDGKVTRAEPPGGPALGLAPGRTDWPETEMPLPESAEVVMFTDGLFEGRTGPGSQRLGEDGLFELALRHTGLPASVFVDALVDGAGAAAADHGGLADDVAVVALGWKKAP